MPLEGDFESKLRAYPELLGQVELARKCCLTMEARGRLVAARNRYIKAQYGEDTLNRVAEVLRPEARKALLDPPLAFSWVPYELMIEIDMAVYDVALNESLSAIREFGAEMAHFDFPRVFGALLQLGTPEFLVKRFDLMVRSYMRPARGVLVEVSKGRAVGVIAGATFPQYICAINIPGFIQAGLEIGGAKDVVVTHPGCLHNGGSDCRYAVTWR